MTDLEKATFLGRARQRGLLGWVTAYSGAAFLVMRIFAAIDAVWADSVPVNLERAAHLLLAFGLVATATLAWFHGEKCRRLIAPFELVILGGLCLIAGLALNPGARIVGIPRALAVPVSIGILLALPVILIVTTRRRPEPEPGTPVADDLPSVDFVGESIDLVEEKEDDLTVRRLRRLWRRLANARTRETLDALKEEMEDLLSHHPRSPGLRRLERALRAQRVGLDELTTSGSTAVDFETAMETKVKWALSLLTSGEAKILELYYGFGHRDALTLEEIARRLSLTPGQVQRIKQEALEKLRNPWLRQGRSFAVRPVGSHHQPMDVQEPAPATAGWQPLGSVMVAVIGVTAWSFCIGFLLSLFFPHLFEFARMPSRLVEMISVLSALGLAIVIMVARHFRGKPSLDE